MWAPTDDVSCAVPLKPTPISNTNQYFTAGYVTGNITDIYPRPFNPDSDKADQFNWDLNDYGTRQTNGETILDLPMFIDSTNNDEETYWSKNPASNNNKPGPYREYYIIKSNGASSATENTATYCVAYAHKDLSSNGDFVRNVSTRVVTLSLQEGRKIQDSLGQRVCGSSMVKEKRDEEVKGELEQIKVKPEAIQIVKGGEAYVVQLMELLLADSRRMLALVL
ncbi:MAG: hypothetical protein ASARMPRED_004819 [Alectoria sarmentosa]|nr:MAG: hypothetical protein ASARMPRED_004819 [Alectoria sarmentosa]